MCLRLQGLNVIVDDCNCQLTCDPTKEGFKDCQPLWKALGLIVHSYSKWCKRLVGVKGNQRFNIIMREAIGKRGPDLNIFCEGVKLPLGKLQLGGGKKRARTEDGGGARIQREKECYDLVLRLRMKRN